MKRKFNLKGRHKISFKIDKVRVTPLRLKQKEMIMKIFFFFFGVFIASILGELSKGFAVGAIGLISFFLLKLSVQYKINLYLER